MNFFVLPRTWLFTFCSIKSTRIRKIWQQRWRRQRWKRRRRQRWQLPRRRLTYLKQKKSVLHQKLNECNFSFRQFSFHIFASPEKMVSIMKKYAADKTFQGWNSGQNRRHYWVGCYGHTIRDRKISIGR